MKIKVSRRYADCDMRCTHLNGYFDCIECRSRKSDIDNVEECTEQQFVKSLMIGNCYITEVNVEDV